MRDSVRNSCPVRGDLLVGGEVFTDSAFTIHTKILGDPSIFAPQITIFALAARSERRFPPRSPSSILCQPGQAIGRQWAAAPPSVSDELRHR